ncbi:MAG TPA: hypothetical protein VGP45_08135 [Marinobacter sp.]|nr:hypothetical protein [Marinobacter sp.]
MPVEQTFLLFLLVLAIAPLVRLSYGRMVVMAPPYTLNVFSQPLNGLTEYAQ